MAGFTTTREPYFTYKPDSVLENDTYKVYCDREFQTDHTITYNRTDVLIMNKKEKKARLIDIAVPAPANVELKQKEKVDKYLTIGEEIKELWGVKHVSIIPVVIGVTGEIPKNVFEGPEKLNIKPNVYLEMQKAVILATCRMIRNVLNKKEQ